MSYHVIIVDDKPLIRRALKETIQWDQLNCIVAGEAEDGKKAYELVKKYHPELLISDIKMPEMDGLELTEHVKKESPDTQVIIITGYQEFEYARKALSLGVSDLVLKPIRNEDMENKIEKALCEFREKKEIQAVVKNAREAKFERLLYDSLQGKKVEFPDCDFSGKNYSLILVKTKNTDKEKKVYETISSWFQKQERVKGWKAYTWLMQSTQVVLLFETGKKSAREWKIILKQSIYFLEDFVEKTEQTECCFTVSKTCNDLGGLSECMQNVCGMMERRYFFSDNKVMFTDHDMEAAGFETRQLQGNLSELRKEAVLLNDEEFQKKLKEVADEILCETNGDEFRIKCILSEFCMGFGKQMQDAWNSEDTNKLLDQIGALPGKQECAAFLTEFVRTIKNKTGMGEKLKNPVVRDGISYIREHYAENFSQTDLAERLGVNPSYLSRLFKKETGHTFMEIVTECRINHAKELLNQPGMRVIEVCQKVGYGDYTYFYQVFKKQEGISPSEYKKNVK